MPFFSRPLDFGSVDRFDDGTGRFTLPLQYHQFFFFVINLARHLRAKHVIDVNGRILVRVDPAMVQLLVQCATDLMAHITAASYGGTLPDDTPITSLRAGSLEELGLLSPAILRLLLYCNGINPLAQQDLPMEFFEEWTSAFQRVATETRDWITVAQRRTLLLGDSCGWNWKSPMSLPSLRRIMDDGRPQNALVLRPRFPAYGVTSASEPGDEPPATKTSTELIPHPIYGPGAQNAMVPYQSQTPVTRTPTDLIPHPIYGPGAQNALVPYRPPTPWIGNRGGSGWIAPPNTIDEEYGSGSDVSEADDESTSSYATAGSHASATPDHEAMYYDVVDVGVQTDPVDLDDSDYDDSDSEGSVSTLEYPDEPRDIIDLTLDDD